MRLPVWRKVYKFHHLSKLCKILGSILNLFQSVTDSIGLMDNLEDCISHRALVEQIIDVGHGVGEIASFPYRLEEESRCGAGEKESCICVRFKLVFFASFEFCESGAKPEPS